MDLLYVLQNNSYIIFVNVNKHFQKKKLRKKGKEGRKREREEGKEGGREKKGKRAPWFKKRGK